MCCGLQTSSFTPHCQSPAGTSGHPVMDYYPTRVRGGGGVILPVASCYRNQSYTTGGLSPTLPLPRLPYNWSSPPVISPLFPWLVSVFSLFYRPTSPEGVESVLSENDDHYDEETRRVRRLVANRPWNQKLLLPFSHVPPSLRKFRCICNELIVQKLAIQRTPICPFCSRFTLANILSEQENFGTS